MRKHLELAFTSHQPINQAVAEALSDPPVFSDTRNWAIQGKPLSGEGKLGKPPSGSPQVVCNGLQIALRPSGFGTGVRFTAFPARFRGEDQDLLNNPISNRNLDGSFGQPRYR